MTSAQITEALAYERLEPWGEDRADRRMAEGWALIANIHRNEKVRSEPFRPADFMPFIAPPAPPTPKRLWARLNAVFDRMKNGRSSR
jgi:hypothetical protein